MPCPKQLARIVQRPWGIADLRFFADDACGERLSGGVAITSGGFDVFVPSAVDQESYDKERMLDTDLLSTWTANCRTGFYETDTDHTNCRLPRQITILVCYTINQLEIWYRESLWYT